MKAFAFVLLCALAAVQGRYTALQSTRTAAAPGENPWLIHLRIAVSTSGLLNTGVGTLISNRWVLTTAANVEIARFIWVRYGAVSVISPDLVTETSTVALNPNYDAGTGAYNIALINGNRNVEFTDTINLISPIGNFAATARYCNYGGTDAPGEVLNCFEVEVTEQEDGSLIATSSEAQSSDYDNGAPLVSESTQFGIRVGSGPEDSIGKFLPTAGYQEWIEQVTGLVLSPETDDDDETDDEDDDDSEVDPEAVRFVQ